MEKIYTVKEAAKILGFSTNTLYKYLDNGAIEAARGVGQQARFRIPHSSIEKFLKTTLTEDQVLKVLNPTEYAKQVQSGMILTKPDTLKIEPPLRSATVFPHLVSRILLFVVLVLTILDLIVSGTFNLSSTILRMSTIVIFILLTYQFGGYTRHK